MLDTKIDPPGTRRGAGTEDGNRIQCRYLQEAAGKVSKLWPSSADAHQPI
jgi:hypothetical protein